jgi:hypothetical protein
MLWSCALIGDCKQIVVRKESHKKVDKITKIVDSTKYIQEAYVFQAIASPNKVYQFRRNEPITNEEFQVRKDLYIQEILNNRIVIKNIPTVVWEGMDFIDYDFYVTHIDSL